MDRDVGNWRSILMFMVCLILNAGCMRASSEVSAEPQKNSELSTFPPDIDPAITLSPQASDALSVDTVGSDTLFNRGFVGYSEIFHNRLSADVQIHAQILTTSIVLSTRIQEVAVMGALEATRAPRTFIKSTQVELQPSELRFQRAGEQRIPFVNGVASFNLSPGESLRVDWVLRASSDGDLCPFRAQQAFPNLIFPQESSHLQWSFVGSNLFGSFTRSIQAALNSGDTAELVSEQEQDLNLSVGTAPSSSDRPLGCNGLMQQLN